MIKPPRYRIKCNVTKWVTSQRNTTMNTTTNVSTRPAAGAEPVKTELTLDWTGMSEDDLKALAQQALIVKLQGSWRKGGIPTSTTVLVSDHKVGTRAPKKSLTEQLSSLSAAERAELIAKLTSMA